MKYLKNIFLSSLALQGIPAFASEVRQESQQVSCLAHVLNNGIDMRSAKFFLKSREEVEKIGNYIFFKGEPVNPSIVDFQTVNGIRISKEIFPARGYRYYISIVDKGNNSYQIIGRDRLWELVEQLKDINPKLKGFRQPHGDLDVTRGEERGKAFADTLVALDTENLGILASDEAFFPPDRELYIELKSGITKLIWNSLMNYEQASYLLLRHILRKCRIKKRNINLKGDLFELNISDHTDIIPDSKSDKYQLTGLFAEAIERDNKYYLNFKKEQLPFEVDSSYYFLIEDEKGETKVPLIARIDKKEGDYYQLFIRLVSMDLFEEFSKDESILQKNLDLIRTYVTNFSNFLKKGPYVWHYGTEGSFTVNDSEIYNKFFKIVNKKIKDLLDLLKLEDLKDLESFKSLLVSQEHPSASNLADNSDNLQLLGKYLDIREKFKAFCGRKTV